ncbi:MAG: hypothetical protein PSN37_01455 [Alphaproteobacteria bacterium]|nr:hypothetical protein [Alphaproteobacteria bacterium]
MDSLLKAIPYLSRRFYSYHIQGIDNHSSLLISEVGSADRIII